MITGQGSAEPPKKPRQAKTAPTVQQEVVSSTPGKPWRCLINEKLIPDSIISNGSSVFEGHGSNVPERAMQFINENSKGLARIYELAKNGTPINLKGDEYAFIMQWGIGLAGDLAKWVSISAFQEEYLDNLDLELETIANIKNPAERGKQFKEWYEITFGEETEDE